MTSDTSSFCKFLIESFEKCGCDLDEILKVLEANNASLSSDKNGEILFISLITGKVKGRCITFCFKLYYDCY